MIKANDWRSCFRIFHFFFYFFYKIFLFWWKFFLCWNRGFLIYSTWNLKMYSDCLIYSYLKWYFNLFVFLNFSFFLFHNSKKFAFEVYTLVLVKREIVFEKIGRRSKQLSTIPRRVWRSNIDVNLILRSHHFDLRKNSLRQT